ncbi:hypothetical protein F2Q69_00002665 [Brassica cretica]|uniref:Uncharacterized protein n=1 Tax=Brassica cretica TaxID=69181 RepID=A0A8S9NWE5_BRACR|nr:hypothetical protein F2Q69_00002665 [Brassica cretica]
MQRGLDGKSSKTMEAMDEEEEGLEEEEEDEEEHVESRKLKLIQFEWLLFK